MFAFTLVLVSTLTGLSGGLAIALWDELEGRGPRRRMKAAAEALGFEIVRTTPRVVARRRRGPPMELRFVPAGTNGRRVASLRVVAHAPPGPAFGVKVGRADSDPRYTIRGDRRQAVLALGEGLRSTLGEGAQLARGEDRLTYTVNVANAGALPQLETLVAELQRAADRLGASPEAQRATLKDLLLTSTGGFESEVLFALVGGPEASIGDDADAAWAVEQAALHPSPTIRLMGAVFSGSGAQTQRLVADPSVPEPIAEWAIARTDDATRLAVLADRAAPAHRRARLLGRPEATDLEHEAWHHRVRRLAVDPVEPVVLRNKAIHALALSQSPDAEDLLLGILEAPRAGTTRWSFDEAWVRKNALLALAQVGTERSLAALHRLSDRAGLYAPLWEPAQFALTRIEARVGALTAGRLSIGPVASAGELSLKDRRTGTRG